MSAVHTPEIGFNTETRERPARRIHITSPFAKSGWINHGFVGAWCPGQALQVTAGGPGHTVANEHGFLLGASEPGAGQRVHARTAGDRLVAFDGYVVDPPLHHRSAPAKITAFWEDRLEKRVNGNFAAAIIDSRGAALTLRTDAFGLTPLYYRVIDELVLFGTSPDYLLLGDETIDRASLLSVLNNGFIVADQTLYDGIHRTPLGGCLTFTGTTLESRRVRFDLKVAGSGEGTFTHRDMDRIQGLFHQAVERCLALDYSEPVMTLTAGLDSRRVLGALLDSGHRPATMTVRIRTDGEDLDATVASRIATRFGLRHTTSELPGPAQYARDDELRCRLVGSETTMHDWSPTLQRLYPDAPAMIFEGFIGDTLQEPLPHWKDTYASPAADLERFAMKLAEEPGPWLARDMLQYSSELAERVRTQLAPYSDRRHITDLAELVTDMRRGIGLGSRFVPPRHLQVRPFFDLDFIQAIFDVDPRIRVQQPVRRLFIERYHPRLAEFDNSPDYVDRKPAPPTRLQRARERACVARAARDLPVRRQYDCLESIVSPRTLTLCALTRVAPAITQRWYWALRPILDTTLQPARSVPVWRIPAV
ncbi:hypothetical protein [Halofilum ochraceum]|uniref:hypothetical protein n=1 Tax=Halofilum ochraceum TaxID=1611323 RepID=UPI00082CAE31|nr:hypothetical protein [Halofilum ochraceum]